MGTSIASARVDADLSAKNEMSCISATHVGSLAKRRRRTLGASGVRRTQTEGARRMRSEEESRVPECAGALASLPRPWRTAATWCCFFTRLSSAPSSTLPKSSSQSPTYDELRPHQRLRLVSPQCEHIPAFGPLSPACSRFRLSTGVVRNAVPMLCSSQSYLPSASLHCAILLISTTATYLLVHLPTTPHSAAWCASYESHHHHAT